MNLKFFGIFCTVILMIFALFVIIPFANAQSVSNFLLYDNSQYGFSIKYPSDWQKQEQLSNDSTFPKVFDVVSFQSPSKLTHYAIMSMKDNDYNGLTDQEFLNKMTQDFGDSLCAPAIKAGAKCTAQNMQKTTFTHPNGYAGYMTINTLTISTDKGTSQPVMGIGMYPDGDKIWILVVLSFSNEATTLQNDLSSMASSFTIKNYNGIQSASTSTTTESSFGMFKINSGIFYVSKYTPDTIALSGNVADFKRGTPITLNIIKPDGTTEIEGAFVKKDGTFDSIVPINGNWKEGKYSMTATYGNDKIGTVYFQVVTSTKPAPQNTITTQSTKSLLYSNTEYGISIQYPSFLYKTNSEQFFQNGIPVVSFSTPTNMTGVAIELIKNDSTFSGLTGIRFLETMKTQYENNFCKYFKENGNTCTIQINSEEGFTSKNGYVGFRALYLVTISNPTDNSKFTMALIPTMFPVGNDVWVLTGGSYSNDEMKSYGNEVDKMIETFTVSDYSEPNLVFNSKATQKDDVVYLVIKNPSESPTAIYSIKLTATSGKIMNFMKIDGWTQKRIDAKSVLYQTISSPINSSDIFKVKLKVDGKNSEIQWETFSKDQKA